MPIKFECPRCRASMKLHQNRRGGYLLCSNEECKRVLLVINYGRGKYEIIKGELPWSTNYQHSGVLRHFSEEGNTSRPPKMVETIRHPSNNQEVAINGF